MNAPVFIPLPGNEVFAERLARITNSDLGCLATRHFPDQETYLKINSDVANRRVTLVCTLAQPDDKLLPLVFAADTCRALGAVEVGLVAPYLAYMRQDCRFEPGEAVTSRSFAELLSTAFDWLITVDPHLHRYKSLADIYAIPTRIVHAAPLIASWIKEHIADPVVIGPDAESEQWVSEVARDSGARYAVLCKHRRGDREIEVHLRDTAALENGTPILVDDILATGKTIAQAIRLLKDFTMQAPVCIAIHGLFAEDAFAKLQLAGARLVTSNTVPHETNEIDVVPIVAEALRAEF